MPRDRDDDSDDEDNRVKHKKKDKKKEKKEKKKEKKRRHTVYPLLIPDIDQIVLFDMSRIVPVCTEGEEKTPRFLLGFR